MKNSLQCIMLIDDNRDDNFFHAREIRKNNLATIVITKTSGMEALDYLKSMKDPHPDLIFLDINMPGMNGWAFLQEYELLEKKSQSPVILIMLTTSENQDDIKRVKSQSFVSDYIKKPLTNEVMNDVIDKYFN